jgi:hypothetical protein
LSARSPSIAAGLVRVRSMSLLTALMPFADAVTEGKKVVTGMLITGLVFISVIALGETSRWLRRRRRGVAH